MTCPKHDSAEEYEHCVRVTMFERIARDAKELLASRQRLLDLQVVGLDWDHQQVTVQDLVKKLEASVRDADLVGLFKEPAKSQG